MNDEQKKVIEAVIYDLADEAVSTGRTNWDGYYGHDNSYHLGSLEEWGAYKRLMKLLEEITKNE